MPPLSALAILSAALGVATSARAADVRPWPQAACQDFARQVSAAIRLPAATSEGNPKTVIDDAPAGRACLVAAGGNGLAQSFAEAETRLERVLAGWKPILEISGGGPGDMFQAYAKDGREVIVLLRREPPAATCQDVVEAECKVPAKRWQWTFKAAAYQK